MNRKEFIEKFSILSFGLATIPKLYANNLNRNEIPGLKSDINGILDLPEGFSYSIISQQGDKMDDGLLVPSNADGMTCIDMGNNKVALIRNHEIGHVPRLSTFFRNNPFGKYYRKFKRENSKYFYDIKKNKTHCFGGTSTIIYNLATEKVESQYLSLAGTLVNCSGGKTPWGTWISCEETTIDKGTGITKNHGYNFEVVPSLTPKLTKPKPLKEMGRFRHEGVAFDQSGNVYQTEDKSDGLFYRFIPNIKEKLDKGGKLQILSFKDWRGVDTRNWKNNFITSNQKYKVKWIDIDDVESPNNDLRIRGNAMGGAIFARGEGIFCMDDTIFFTATIGGKNKSGQIWKYEPYKNSSEGEIELFYESKNSNDLNMPDNIVLAPNGSVIVCEDGKGTDRLVSINKEKKISYLAKNALNNSEIAGVCFSPDHKTLFLNMYKPTITFAIKGPWDKV